MLRSTTSLARQGLRIARRHAVTATAVPGASFSAVSRTTGVSTFEGCKRMAASRQAMASGFPFVRHFASGGTTTVEVPSMGDSITEGTVVQWMKAPGDSVEIDEVVVVLETDKVSIDVRAPQAGVLAEALAEEGDTVEVGAPLMKLDASGAGGGTEKMDPKQEKDGTEEKSPAAATVPKPAPAPKPEEAKEPPTPSTQDPAKSSASAPAAAPSSAPPGPDQKVNLPAIEPASPGDRTESRVKMTRMRMRIAERLKSAQNTAAMLTTFQECDMTNLMNMRKTYKETFEKKHGIKLGFMSCFVKASADTLREMPAVNGYIDDKAKEIVYRNYVDISVAVSSPNGLVVPVLRNVEDMDFASVEKAIAEYGQKAKKGVLALEDMAGGTFTISNGGVFGSLMGTPIINPPQSAILGMHATKMRPVVMPDGSIAARPMMYLALTYDHRLIDGREAVTFLKSVAMKVEDPQRLLLDL